MKCTYSKSQMLILVIILFLSIKLSLSQSIGEITRPKFSSQSIIYSILANLNKYLKYENNKDVENFIEALTNLNQKIGALKDSYFNESRFNSVNKSYN